MPDQEAPVVKQQAKSKAKRKKQDKQQGITLKFDELSAEAGVFTEDPGPDTNLYLHGGFSAKWQPDRDWELMLGARVYGYGHGGSPHYREVLLDYAENFIRWRGERTRVTVGTQNVLWGRVDEMPPTDRLSRADLTRAVLDKLSARRRAVPAVRLEQFAGDYKIDAVWVPVFDPAVLPEMDSVWHPLDRRNGRILGIGAVPLAALPGTRFREDGGGGGGFGVRVTRTGGAVDYGFSLQRSRQSMPYYRLDATAPTPLFTAVHPYSWVVGGELEMQKGGATWRLEGTYSRDLPVTTRAGQYRTEEAVDLVLGAEFYPGDGDTRLTLQLFGHETFNDVPVLDRTHSYGLSGEIEHPFARGRWRANVRFFAGLDERDVYLNPRLTYLGFEPHELYLAAHVFSGGARTLGGHYQDNDMIVLGWQSKF